MDTESLNKYTKTLVKSINNKPRRQPINLEGKINEAIKILWENIITRKCDLSLKYVINLCREKGKERWSNMLRLQAVENLITERQAFPMPAVHEMLDNIY